MCEGVHHVFVIAEVESDEDLNGLRCQCGRIMLQRVVCPTCGAVRIEQRPVVLVGLN